MHGDKLEGGVVIISDRVRKGTWIKVIIVQMERGGKI